MQAESAASAGDHAGTSARGWAASGWGEGGTWEEALQDALSQLTAQPWNAKAGSGGGQRDAATIQPDLLCLFASAEFADEYSPLLARAREATNARVVAGCSGWGVIGGARELEGRPAISLLAASLPGATLTPVRLTQHQVAAAPVAEDGAALWHRVTGVAPEDVSAWLVFADPFRLDVEALIAGLSAAYPGTPIVGGLASGDAYAQGTHVFLDGEVFREGAVAVAIGGAWTVQTIVSQGCTPIGEAWTITGAEGHQIQTIARRPAYEVLVDTVKALPPELIARTRGNLFAGLAMDELRDTLGRGDFLVRNLLGADPTSGALVVGAEPYLGQTLQFQLRDAAAADEDLRTRLDRAAEQLQGRAPVAALLCSCTGRGRGLFGVADHDARAVSERFGQLPLAGFFCNGEFGPVGNQNFVHGYTASVALLVLKPEV